MREGLIVAGAVIATLGVALCSIPLGVTLAGLLMVAVAYLSE